MRYFDEKYSVLIAHNKEEVKAFNWINFPFKK